MGNLEKVILREKECGGSIIPPPTRLILHQMRQRSRQQRVEVKGRRGENLANSLNKLHEVKIDLILSKV
jgi:hypothetical protein